MVDPAEPHTMLRRVKARIQDVLERPRAPLRPGARRADELNTALFELSRRAGHSRESFNARVAPMYVCLLQALATQQSTDAAEAIVLQLLQSTTAACRRRASTLLPKRRPGTDYRRYDKIYTYALITAMAVERYQREAGLFTQPPAETAMELLPEEGMTVLQETAFVWQDWLGFFEQARVGGLYAVAHPDAAAPVSETPSPSAAVTPQETPPRCQAAVATPENPTKTYVADRITAALRQALADKTIESNSAQAFVNVDRLGRVHLRTPDVFEALKNVNHWPETAKQLSNQFRRSPTCLRTRNGKNTFKGRYDARSEWVMGVVIRDATLLWPEGPPAGNFRISAPAE